MKPAALTLLGLATIAPLLFSWRRLSHWVSPIAALITLAATGACTAAAKPVHGPVSVLFTVALTILAAMAGGMPLPPAAFRVARRQPDSGRPISTPSTPSGPLRGGRMIGLLERGAVAATLLASWPEGIAIILGIKSLARYPDLRDSNVSEQFIIGTFTSVLWSVATAAIGRDLIAAAPILHRS